MREERDRLFYGERALAAEELDKELPFFDESLEEEEEIEFFDWKKLLSSKYDQLFKDKYGNLFTYEEVEKLPREEIRKRGIHIL